MGSAIQGVQGAAGPGRQWRGLLALALLALSVMLVRPMCEVFDGAHIAPGAGLAAALAHGGTPGHHSGDELGCCAALDETAQVSAAVSASSHAKPIAPYQHAVSPAPVLPQHGASPGNRVRNSLRSVAYHARTARILV